VSVVIELSYDMGKAIGERRIELSNPATVRDAVAEVSVRFAAGGADFEALSTVTSIAINGVLVKYGRGLNTRLHDGDVVAFVKAASGG